MLHDFRAGWRSLLRSPLFTFTAAGSLALGIGACTVIFSVVYTLLLQPLPYRHPAELVHVGIGNPLLGEEAFGGLPPATLQDIRANPKSGFASLGGFCYDYINLTGVPTPSQLLVGYATVDYLSLLGVPPRLGRLFYAADCRASSPPTVVLSDRTWRTQFNAAEGIVGQMVTLADQPRTVIGVMPPSFKEPSSACDLWLPLAEDGPDMAASANRRLITLGRLAGTDAGAQAQVRALLRTMAANLAQTDPANFKGLEMQTRPLRSVIVSGTVTQALWLLLGAVGCVLLVTCANVANLQLVRAGARRREVGVRLALGASRARILRLCLAESLLLAVLGGGIGVLGACWGIDAVAALLPPGSSPFQDEIRLSLPVLGFSVAVSALTGMVTGLLPAWAASRQDPAGSLAAGGRGASEGLAGARARAVFVVAEIALALVLLAGAGLLGRSFLSTLRTSAGLRTERTLMLNLSVSEKLYAEAAPRRAYLQRLLENINAVPGVTGTALSSTEPFNWFIDMRFLLPGQSEGTPESTRQVAAFDAVNPEFFTTLGIPILQGRPFDAHDDANGAHVVIVNKAFVHQFLPEGNPLGRRFSVVGARAPTTLEIIGVTGDVRRNGLDTNAPPQIYVCFLQRPQSYGTFYVRAAGNLSAESLTKGVQSAIWQVNPDQPIGKVSTLAQAVAGSVATGRLYLILFGGFAAIALSLAVLGIYGTVAYSVNQRTREIGIRLALGAQRQDILRLVLWQGARLIGAGLVVGLLVSTGLGRLLTKLLYGVTATDPATLAGVVVVLGAAALLASYLPARRATRVDPLVALREE